MSKILYVVLNGFTLCTIEPGTRNEATVIAGSPLMGPAPGKVTLKTRDRLRVATRADFVRHRIEPPKVERWKGW
jgi:hypothetical protein